MANQIDLLGVKALAAVETMIERIDSMIKQGITGEAESLAAELMKALDSKEFIVGRPLDSAQRRIASVQARASNSLRKLGFAKDALMLARRAFFAGASNIWVVRAYGWALRDAIRKAKEDKDDKAALDLVLEFDRVQLPETETILLEQRAHYHVGLVGTEQHLADAFRIAKKKHLEYPHDPRTAKEYFWVLADCVEQAVWLRKMDLARQFYAEIEKLPRTDEMQNNKILGLRAKLDPVYALRQEAAFVSKQGDHAKAAAIYREAIRQLPESSSAQEGLGWELARLLQTELSRKEPDAKSIKAMLDEYLTLAQVGKPSKLHSWLLSLATRAAEAIGYQYFSFVKVWGIEHLREDDFKPYQPEVADENLHPIATPLPAVKRKVYPSLAEKVGMSLGKLAKSIKSGTVPEGVDLLWVAETLGMLAGRFPAHPWITYHFAMLLLKTGACEDARKRLIPLVRAKHDEFWVWAALAETYPGKSRERLTCLCRASRCSVNNDGFLLRMRMNLRDALKASGNTEASREVDLLIPRAVFSDVNETVHKKKATKPTISAASDELIKRYADEADSLVMADIPWIPAMVSGVIASKPGIKACVFVLARGADGDFEMRINPKRFHCLSDVKVGTPLSVRFSKSDGRVSVMDVNSRAGELWDLVPVRFGVVSYLNKDKGLAVITIDIDRVTLAHFDHFPEAINLREGDFLDVRCQSNIEGMTDRLVWFQRVTQTPTVDFVKRYQGKYLKNEIGAYGFVDDVFVSQALTGDASGIELSGLAVLETNRKTGQKGWRAVTAHQLS